MKRIWFSLALLSASWLFGLSYYNDANFFVWAIFIAAGTGLLIGEKFHRPTAFQAAAAGIMLLFAVKYAPWPYRIAPLLIFTGLVFYSLPVPRKWPGIIASAFMHSGIILTVQAPAMLTYEYVTARSHELLWPAPNLLYIICKFIAVKCGLNNSSLALYTPRVVHLLGTTWELLLDPAAFCILAGGIAVLFLHRRQFSKKVNIKLPIIFILLFIIWLALRFALIAGIFLHRALLTKYDSDLVIVPMLWNRWFLIAFLPGLVLLIIRFIQITPAVAEQIIPAEIENLQSGNLKIIALTAAGGFLLIAGLLLDTPGPAKQGRVMVEEAHSDWERTDTPFDTNWYGQESGYNYACIYDYSSRFYEMSRLEKETTDEALIDCDVLIVKVPTERYSPQEIAAIERFVKRGGGLMLVAEHTSVFNSGVFINDIAEVFGLRFRYDCLFDIDTKFEQLYTLPIVPHPIVQNMPAMNFAVSCSLYPGAGLGRGVIRSTSLKNLPADYHASNYYPQVEDHAYMRYGAFVQLWAKRYGKGRIVAFTDSTIFSNFSTFEEGKAELMLGMINWLNHRNTAFDPRAFMIVLGISVIAGAFVFAGRFKVTGLILISAVYFGWAMAVVGVQTIHRYSLPAPEVKRPMINITIDRTVCDSPLSTSGFISGEQNGFGIFERWILRLGYFTKREQGLDALTGNLVVFTQPNQIVQNEYREKLVDYVTAGGNILILDSPENTGSTANSLLYPFGISINHSTQLAGQLQAPESWPTIELTSACRIEGGEPFMLINNLPVAVKATIGKGTVTVIGFGSRFADAYMGTTGDVVPDAELRKVFDLQFNILRSIISGT